MRLTVTRMASAAKARGALNARAADFRDKAVANVTDWLKLDWTRPPRNPMRKAAERGAS